VEISARSFVAEGNRYFQSIARDLTERKQAETLLRLTRFSIDHAADSVFWTDLDGRIILVSDSTCRRHGYSQDEFLTMSLADLDPSFSEERWAVTRETIKAEGDTKIESAHRTKSGEIFPVEVYANYLEFDGREYVCVFARDVTERKRFEEVLKASEEQLRQSQKMEAVGQLAGGIAHDFNNILTAIIGYSEMLLFSPELADSPARQDAEEIKRAAERAASLTAQILAFSRRQALRPSLVSLNNVIAGMEPLLRLTLGGDIDVVNRLDPELGPVEVDVHQFEQVVMNLALNARDAMTSGGRLTLQTANAELDEEFCRSHPLATPGSYVTLAVSDAGTGMDGATLARIFEPFFTTKETGKGTGLGLSTAYGIVNQSGGSISVDSALGSGTTFTIYLPRLAAHEAPVKTVAAEGIPGGGRETIMVVDDEPSLLSLIARVLTHQGYGVVTFASAYEAALALRQGYEGVDLLLTDVVLPGVMQGKDLYDEVQVSRPDLPVLFMSGYTRNVIVHAGRLDEGVRLLEKPFTPDVLTRTVRQVLDQAQASR
jgi:two-component system cell cycle sensor histidine kinase/response regulator CckA